MKVALVVLIALPACTAVAAPPEVITPTVISTRPHDTSAFTQGLLLHDGWLFESTGGYDTPDEWGDYGPSTLRQVDPVTGEVEESIELPKDASSPDNSYFGEGLARVGDRLIQLTWQENTAFVWTIDTFTEVERHSYSGQGWGLCYDGTRLVMSDGSATLTFRDPTDFSVLGSLPVTLETASGDFEPVLWLNELECVGSSVYANVFTTDWIVEIDASSGHVLRRIHATGLLTQTELDAGADVLNGIAHDPATGRFLITGKLWPKLFEMSFGNTIADGGPTDGGATDGGATDGDSSDGDLTDGGSTDGGVADGGPTDGGSGDDASPSDSGPQPPTVKSTSCAAAPPWTAMSIAACVICRRQRWR